MSMIHIKDTSIKTSVAAVYGDFGAFLGII